MEPIYRAVEVRNLNHWTAREIPTLNSFFPPLHQQGWIVMAHSSDNKNKESMVQHLEDYFFVCGFGNKFFFLFKYI